MIRTSTISSRFNSSVSSKRRRPELKKQLEARKLKKRRQLRRPNRKLRSRKSARSVKPLQPEVLMVVHRMPTLTREL
jgi:hypothetical protein